MNFKIGVSPVASGQRATSAEVEPQLIVKNGRGSFGLSASATRAMNLSVGDYVQFHNNIDGVMNLINSKDEKFLEYCDENSLDITTDEGIATTVAELSQWYISKGYQLFSPKGKAMKVSERTTKEDKKAYIDANKDVIVDSLREALVERAVKDGKEGAELSDEELAMYISVDDVQSGEKDQYSGSLTANVAKRVGVGAPVTFTDSNIWGQLRGEAKEKQNAIYSVEVTEGEDVVVTNGYKDITIRIYPINFQECTEVIQRTPVK